MHFEAGIECYRIIYAGLGIANADIMPSLSYVSRVLLFRETLKILTSQGSMAHTITTLDHLSAICEDGFSYSFASGFNYEGIKRLPVSELRGCLGLNQ